MEDDQLGREIHVAQYTLEGLVTRQFCHWLNEKIAQLIGMDMGGMHAAVWSYPVGGKGGVGFTYVQPITTSFMVWDAWADHELAYFQVTSCRPFETAKLTALLETYFRVVEVVSHRMGLGGGM